MNTWMAQVREGGVRRGSVERAQRTNGPQPRADTGRSVQLARERGSFLVAAPQVGDWQLALAAIEATARASQARGSIDATPVQRGSEAFSSQHLYRQVSIATTCSADIYDR